MKNFTLLFSALLLTAFSWQANAQILNQAAAWPNATWTLGGTYNATALLSDPTTSSNFSYDDDAAGSGSTDILEAASPVIDLTAAAGGGETWINVDYNYNYNLGGTFDLEWYDTDALSWVIWEVIPDNSSSTSGWCAAIAAPIVTSATLDISGFTATQLAGFQYRFHYDASSGWGWGMCTSSPTIVSSPPPSCLDPSAGTATNITSSSADLGWTENGTATSWDLEYGAAPYAPTGTPTVSGVTNPYNYSGLTASATYEFYVRADCGGANGVSSWAGPYSFTTSFACPAGAECATLAAEISTDFDFTALPGTSACPGTLSVTIPAGNVIDSVTTFYDMSAVGGGWMAEQVSWLYSPTVGAGEAAVSNGAGNSTGTINYNRTGLSFANFAAGTVDFELHAGRSYGGAGCDNTFNLVEQGWSVIVYYSLAPACLPPSLLTSSNITSNSVDLGWTSAGTETMWNIEYGPTGFTPGTGTIVAAGTNPYALAGLTPNETYDFWVQADCGGDSSDYGGPSSFTTPCSIIAAPWFDDAEGHSGTTNSSIANCWSSSPSGNAGVYRWDVSVLGTTPSSGTGPLVANSGSNFFHTEASQGAAADIAELYSPNIDLTALTAPELKFFYHMNGIVMGDLYVDIYDGATWSTVDSIIGQQQAAQSDLWLEKTIDISAFSGTIQVKLTAISGGSWEGDICLDDFSIDNAILNDLKVLEVTSSAANGCGLSNAETVTIEIQNNGVADQTNFDVGYSLNGMPIVPETINATILSGGTLLYTFTAAADMSIPMVYNIDAYTLLASDQVMSNDTSVFSANHIAPSLTFTDSLLITDGLSNGTHGIICTNGLLPNELNNCYKLSAVVIDSLVHTWDSDLTMYLITPNGDSIQLSSGNGGSGDDYIGVVFTDTAATSITTGTAGFGAGGYYSIEDVNGLGSYIGFDPNGMWDLWITDGAAGDNGILFAWHLEFQDYSFTVDLGADAALCSGQDSLMLDAGAGTYTYEWSNMEATQTIMVSDSTVGTVNYSVVVTDSISMCEALDTISVSYGDCSGISELSGSTVSVYPNPSNGNFIISLSNISEQVSVQVVDMQGRIIYSQTEGLKVGKENVISLDNVERGLYLISVSSEKGRYTQSIVIE